MRRAIRIGLLAALCGLALQLSLRAQQIVDEDEPYWLLLERGKKLFDEREYGEALRFFRAALENRVVYPEADFWIGKVFEAEATYPLAERQYQRAFDQRNQLQIPEQAFTILYRLADIQRNSKKYQPYAETLQTIITLHLDESEPQGPNPRPDVIHRVLLNQGVDKLIELYRIQNKPRAMAYAELGIYQYRTGRYLTGAYNLSYSVTVGLTTLVEYLIAKDPEYRYLTVSAVLEDADRYRALEEYSQDVELFQQMYYLALCLYGDGKIGAANSLWRIVAERADNDWAAWALLQLDSPRHEPLLEI